MRALQKIALQDSVIELSNISFSQDRLEGNDVDKMMEEWVLHLALSSVSLAADLGIRTSILEWREGVASLRPQVRN